MESRAGIAHRSQNPREKITRILRLKKRPYIPKNTKHQIIIILLRLSNYCKLSPFQLSDSVGRDSAHNFFPIIGSTSVVPAVFRSSCRECDLRVIFKLIADAHKLRASSDTTRKVRRIQMNLKTFF